MLQVACSELVVSLNLETLSQFKSALKYICDELDWKVVVRGRYERDMDMWNNSIEVNIDHLRLFSYDPEEIPHPDDNDNGLRQSYAIGVPVDMYPHEGAEKRWTHKYGFYHVSLEFQSWGHTNTLGIGTSDGYCDSRAIISADQHVVSDQFSPLAKVALLFDAEWHTEDGGSPFMFAKFLKEMDLLGKVRHKHYNRLHLMKMLGDAKQGRDIGWW
jgi:hypothetical protein